MKTVVLVDDHEIVRDGIKNLVESTGEYIVVGEGTNVADAQKLIEKLNPHVLITDLTLHDSSGLDLARSVRATHPSLPVLVLSMHDSEDYIRSALDSGALGYLLKDCSRSELFTALSTVLSGKIFVGKSVSQILLNQMLNKTPKGVTQKSQPVPESQPSFELTKREQEVLSMIYTGLSNKEIAVKMHVSVRTVDAHRYNLLQKLQVRNTAELLNKATRFKLIVPST
jgi:DNA-binding NarL/FixJ family response regulator